MGGAAARRAPAGCCSGWPTWCASGRLRSSELERADTGKIDARPELAGLTTANYFEMYGQLVRGLRGETIALGPGLHAFTRREPWGVVGIITPWNAPFNQAAREAARRWRPATPSS